MKKKEIIFWAVLICISIVFASVVIFYKPITAPSRYDTISARAASNTFSVKQGEDNYDYFKKTVNKAINSSRYSLFNPSSTDKISCDEVTVFAYKLTKKYWVECFPSKGKYKMLFFFADENSAGRQTLLVFASENKDNYDGGKLILLYSVNTPALIDSLSDAR